MLLLGFGGLFQLLWDYDLLFDEKVTQPLRHTSISYPRSGTMPGNTSPAFTRSAAFAVGEEQCLCVDINCHSKSITAPVTVVLGLAVVLNMPRLAVRNPRQMCFFFAARNESSPRYMHFGKKDRLLSSPRGLTRRAAYTQPLEGLNLAAGRNKTSEKNLLPPETPSRGSTESRTGAAA